VANSEQFLSFEIGRQMGGMLRTKELVKVLSVDRTTIVQIPDMPGAVVGVCPWEGEVLWLVDLGYLLGYPPIFTPDYLDQKCSVIVARASPPAVGASPSAVGRASPPAVGETVGVLVNKVGKVMQCEITELSLPHAKIKEAKCIRGSWQNDRGESWLVLDAEAIASSL